ncbi:nuclear transport factor 2-like [Hibiscus syriacus]|uniref:nuclear transport factor 2-like n=1 Tax=Hibiscus syriacus TaxID=106335 RepID=UPI001924C307|nr:nuclear transport factor 2-like [Hibiscus syriacus]
MATSYPGPLKVGAYFVGQYYRVLRHEPHLVHQFYSDASSMIRVDGDSSESASSMLQIHTLAMSLNYTTIVIKTINSLDSWNGGVLVMVSGSVKIKDFNGRRKFVQTFFLAPQYKGYFVLNDIFQFIDDGIVYQHPASTLQERKLDSKLDVSIPVAKPPVSDEVFEEEISKYVSSVLIEDDPVEKYSPPEQPEQDVEDTVQERPATPLEEPVEEPPRRTYASVVSAPILLFLQTFCLHVSVHLLPFVFKVSHSLLPIYLFNQLYFYLNKPYVFILNATIKYRGGIHNTGLYVTELGIPKSQSASFVQVQHSYNKIPPSTSDWDHTAECTSQQSRPACPYLPESAAETTSVEYFRNWNLIWLLMFLHLGEYTGEYKSVYVGNLPPTVTATEIEQVFKNFGKIKPDGVFVRNRTDVIGVCYAFVEFEDLLSVHKAIKASPIQFAGRRVYIDERRPNSSSSWWEGRSGRGRGRGRGSYPAESSRGRISSRSLGVGK